MINNPDSINEDILLDAISTRWLGRRFVVYDTIGSTNDRLKTLSMRGEPHGTMIITDYQSAGRGRLGRHWEAPARTSLLFSLLLRPGWAAVKAQWITMISGLSAIEAIRSRTGIQARLKWPNDIVIGTMTSWRKVGGILLDGVIQGSLLESIVLGIGINVNIPPPLLPESESAPTSLMIEAGRRIPRIPILAQFLQEMEGRYEALREGHSPVEEWKVNLVTLGQTVQATYADTESVLIGMAIDTDEMGQLLVLDREGTTHTISAADVTIVS